MKFNKNIVNNITKSTLVFSLIIGSFGVAQAQNYSNDAISLYNSAARLQQQGSYQLAEQKYNQVLKIQPDMSEAKSNLSMMLYNQANDYYSNGDYKQALILAKKALALNPKDTNYSNFLGQCYCDIKDFNNSAIFYQKTLQIDSNDDNALQGLAEAYVKTNQLTKALNIYKKILAITPNDEVAVNNIRAIKSKLSELQLGTSLNTNTQVQEHAPSAIYKLIKPERGISLETVAETKNMLDLIWSEQNGRILLSALANRNIPINILSGNVGADSVKTNNNDSFMSFDGIPISAGNNTRICVNMPGYYADNFYNKNISTQKRLYCLHGFVHEFVHAFMSVKNSAHTNSMEEEIGASMVGYNIAFKVLTGKYMTKEQTEIYSTMILKSVLTDDHKDLPVFGDFNATIQSYGITLPYVEVYTDIPSMYKKLLAEGKTAPNPQFNYSY